MRLLRMLIVSAGAALTLGATVSPAQAAAPSTEGCTFDRSNGRTTCVTTTTSTRTLGPFSGAGPSSDGSVLGQRCLQNDPIFTYYSVVDAFFTATTVTTTTSTYQGRSPDDGTKVTSYEQSSTRYDYVGGRSQCVPYPV